MPSAISRATAAETNSPQRRFWLGRALAELLPERGVYVTRMSLDGGSNYLDAVTNVGVRPTFGEGKFAIETYVLHDPVLLTARTARLQFLRRIRDERRFDSPELLRQQIARDVRTAKRFFGLLGSHVRTHSR